MSKTPSPANRERERRLAEALRTNLRKRKARTREEKADGEDAVMYGGGGNDTLYGDAGNDTMNGGRSEEHTSELQSLMRISYACFCLKKKNTTHTHTNTI